MIRGAALTLATLALAALAAVPAVAQPTADAVSRYQTPRLGDGLDVAHAPTEAARRDPPPDDWLARDKAMHLGASFVLTLAGQYVLTDKGAMTNGEALPLSASAALAAGLAKEVMDSRREHHPHFCWRDLAADAAGVALAAAVVGL